MKLLITPIVWFWLILCAIGAWFDGASVAEIKAELNECWSLFRNP